jgi:type II secretory pathway component PulK
MKARWFAVPALVLEAVLLAGCTPDSVREHTADLTAMAKRNAGAVVKGVFEGLMRKGPTNINKASAKDLQALPDVTPQQAQAIIAGRPYDNTSELVKKQIMPQSQYNKLRTQMIVK